MGSWRGLWRGMGWFRGIMGEVVGEYLTVCDFGRNLAEDGWKVTVLPRISLIHVQDYRNAHVGVFDLGEICCQPGDTL